MPDDDSTIRVSLASILNEIKLSIAEMRKETGDAFKSLEAKLTQEHIALAIRVSAMESRQDRHEPGDDHARLTDVHDRLGKAEEKVKEQRRSSRRTRSARSGG